MNRLFHFKKHKTLPFLIITFSLLLFSLSSCLKNDRDNETIGAALTVINGAPDAPAFDFILNGDFLFGNVPYETRILYFSLFPGTYQASFYKYQTFTNPLLTTNITLAEGKYHSLFLAGTVADSLSSLLIEDDLTKPKTGTAKVRFINLSPNAGSLNFSIVADSLFTSQKQFKQYTDFHEIPAGNYNARFESSIDTIADFTFDLKLEEGKIYTVWARGLVNASNENQKFENGLIVHGIQ
jgi:hypothetical protein